MMAEAVISGLGVACRLPLTVVAEGGCMAIKGLEQAVENLSRISRTAVPGVPPQWPLTALLHPRYRSRRHRLPVRQRYAGNW